MIISEASPKSDAVEHLESRIAAGFSEESGRSRPIALYLLWIILLLCACGPMLSDDVALAYRLSGRGIFMLALGTISTIAGCYAAIRRGRHVKAEPSWFGVICILAGACVSFFARLMHLNMTYYLSVLLIITGACYALGGYRILKNWAPVLLFSILLIPSVPQELALKITLPMQLLSTKLMVFGASYFMPIQSHGHIFLINNELFDVEPGCSGLKMCTSFVFATLLWGMFQHFSVRRYFLVLLATPFLAIVFNAIRLLVVAIVAYHAGRAQAMQLHSNIEAIFLPIGVFILVKFGGWIDRKSPEKLV